MAEKSSCLWFDKRIIIFLIVCYIQNVTSFWEYAICTDSNIELYDSSWNRLNNSKFSIEIEGFTKMKSITYDVNNDVFYFVDNQKFKAGIYKLKVHNETTYEVSNLEVNRHDQIRDLVIDTVEDTLYWSDSENQKIFRLKLNPLGKVEEFLDVSYDIEGLEIDTCGRKLFFVKKYKKKLSFVSLDDPKRVQTEVLGGEHNVPVAIAIDHQTRRLYVADIQKSVHYSIDSILTNGDDFRNELDSSMKMPRSIAVDKDYVYYVEGTGQELRRFSKKYEGLKKTSEMIKKFAKDPKDIIVRSNFVTDLNSELCKIKNEETTQKAVLKSEKVEDITTKTSVEQSTETCACPQQLCNVDKCNNFCLNDGECSIVKEEAKCACKPGFAGDRCEVDKCTNFCLNGKCSVNDDTKEPQCICEASFSGKRCEKSTEEVPESLKILNDGHHSEMLEECPQKILYTHAIVSICVLLSLMVFFAILLVLKKMQRPQRPRVKKTFKVHKNIEPLTYRPHTDHCEVIIEDCCNMNICETPCYDPKVLQKEINESNLSVKLMPSRCSSKDDKQDLLKNMEYNQ